MTPTDEAMISRLPDADMQAVPRALLRAALRARDVARETDTSLVLMRDGVLVEELPAGTTRADAVLGPPAAKPR